MKIISALANKGGVGKTNLTTNLAANLAKNNRVLLVDLDSQANATSSFGLRNNPLSIYDIYRGYKTPQEVIINYNTNLDILPSNRELSKLIFHMDEPTIFSLLDFLKELDYDYIILDTPPSLELIARNVLKVADEVFIPFVPELFSVDSLINVVEIVEQFQEKRKGLVISGVVAYMVDNRLKLHKDLLEQVEDYCEQKGLVLFKTQIPRSVQFANSVVYEKVPALLGKKQTDKTNTLNELFEEMRGE